MGIRASMAAAMRQSMSRRTVSPCPEVVAKLSGLLRAGSFVETVGLLVRLLGVTNGSRYG